MRIYVLALMFLINFCYVVTSVYSASASYSKKCTSPGPFCETCSSLVACIENDESGFIKEPIEPCESPKRCVGGFCVTNTTDPICNGLADLDFICRQVGIFPDPFYCNKFVLCVNISESLTPYVNECEEGFQYNLASSLCDIKLEHGQCPEGIYPVPLCQLAGQSGPLAQKPEMYYVCERYSEKNDVLYPVLNVCPGGMVYENYECIDKDAFSTTEPTWSMRTSASTAKYV